MKKEFSDIKADAEQSLKRYQLECELKSKYYELGKNVYNNWRNKENLNKSISSILNDIDLLTEKLATINNSV